MSVFFKSRKAIACLPAICLLAVAVHSAMNSDLKITPRYDNTTVEVALIDPEELQAKPEPEPVVEPPPPPEEEVVETPIIEPPPVPKPRLKPQPPKVKPQVAKAVPPPPKAQPAVQAPLPASRPAPAPASTPTAEAAVAQVKPVAQPPHVKPADPESRYTARLLAELEKYKQYPRGREASLQRPEGNVVVWLLVDRSGKVLESGIEKRAPNMLLNRAAQTSLNRLDKVMPFPEESFSGKDKYRFSATLVYNIEQ